MKLLRIFPLATTLFCSVLLAPSLGYGAPRIDSVTQEPDGRIVILGSGFGERPDFSPNDSSKMNLAWSTFESGRVNGEGFTVTEGLGRNWRITADGSRRFGGFHSQKFFNDGRLGALAYRQTQNPGRWYTSFWFRLLPNTQGGKFFRMYADAPGNNVYLMTGGSDTMIRGFSESTGINPNPATQWSSPQHLGHNEWHRVEVWMSENPSEVTVWIDGLHQWTKTNWLPPSFLTAGHTWDLGNMIDDPAKSGGQNGAYCFDDIFVDYTRARVELTGSPLFDLSRQREIQIPLEWTDNRIVVRRNLGAFSPTDQLYIHVVDENGHTASEGKQLTLAGDGDVLEKNQAPNVQTGQALEMPAGALARLVGTATDDTPSDLSSKLITIWSQVLGPTNVLLENPYELEANVRITSPGRYVFRLFAYDGQLLGFADQEITVTGSPDSGGASALKVTNLIRPGVQSADFEYELPNATSVKISILDRLGQEVVRLVDELQPAGVHHASWKGHTSTGQEVVSGLYLAQVETGEKKEYKKLVVVR